MTPTGDRGRAGVGVGAVREATTNPLADRVPEGHGRLASLVILGGLR